MLAEFDVASGNIPQEVFLAKVRDELQNVLEDGKVDLGEVERIKTLLASRADG